MATYRLNLTNKEEGDIDYELIKYPDSQVEIRLTDNNNIGWKQGNIDIVSRMSWSDLQVIMCTKKHLDNLGIKNVKLTIKYFLGARSDRSFTKGGVRYLQQVICPIINSLGFYRVTVMDAHSNVLENCLNNIDIISNAELVLYALQDICKPLEYEQDYTKDLVWLIPDKGAEAKAYGTAKEVKFAGTMVQCHKKRDKLTGKITSIDIDHEFIFNAEDCVIVDDISSNGGTFLGLAETAKKRGAGKLYLIVTHFEGGQDPYQTMINLGKYYDHLYCTNSFSDLKDSWKTLMSPPNNFWTQLNIMK